MAWVTGHVSLIEKLLAYQICGAEPPENSKAKYFEYFWQECTGAGLGAGFLKPIENDIVRLFNALFIVPEIWDTTSPQCLININKFGRAVKKDTKNPTDIFLPSDRTLTLRAPDAWRGVDDTVLLNVLSHLLQTGFVKVPARLGTQGPDSGTDVYRAVMVQSFDGVKFKLGWRGDSRSIKAIRDAGGLINKAESDRYAESVNLRAPWNPFSLVENRTCYYFRRTQSDNCLYSVVSISTEFRTSTVFPLLGDVKNRPSSLPDPRDNFAALKPVHRRLLHLVSGNGQKTIRMADAQQLYLVAVNDAFFDTRRAQEQVAQGQGFPEFAVKLVPETGVLGCVKYVRVHHGLDQHAGQTVLLDKNGSVRPTLDGCRRFCQDQKAARIVFRAAAKLYDDAVTSMPFHVKWISTMPGYAEVPAMTVNRVSITKIDSVKDLLSGRLWP